MDMQTTRVVIAYVVGLPIIFGVLYALFQTWLKIFFFIVNML